MRLDPAISALPRERLPAIANAARYWLDIGGFIDRLEHLGDRFVVTMPGSGPWVCMTHPRDIEVLFRSDSEAAYFGEALRMLSPHELVLGPANLTSLDGPEHLAKRRLLLPAFHGESLKRYEAAIEEKAHEAAARWPVGPQAESMPETARVTLEIIMAAIFGVTQQARLDRLRAAVMALNDEIGSRRFLLQTAISTARNDGFSRPFSRIEARKTAVDAVVLEEIAERRAGPHHDQRDVLASLLAVRDEHGQGLGNAEICDQMRLMLLGGHDTTAATISWILDLITHNPLALRELEDTVRAGSDEYLTAVIQESLRLRPVFPFTVRLAKKPLEFDGLTIPPGTLVVPFIALVHRRPDIYPDPLAFKPERFLDSRPGSYSWIPFGGGMRRCIGAAMAQLEATIIIRTLVQELDLRPAHPRCERLGRHSVLTVPADGGTTIAARRTPSKPAHPR
jgi:cytochrome P450